MMRQVFETHQPSIPIEELLKAAATGDVQTMDEVIIMSLVLWSQSIEVPLNVLLFFCLHAVVVPW